jgi:hypothetical protein
MRAAYDDSSAIIVTRKRDDNARFRSVRKLASCSVGIFVSYFLFGVLQENM